MEADFQAPAAGGNIGQVAYDAPVVGGDLINVSAKAIAIQRGEVDPVYADLAFLGSGGVMAGSGEAMASAAPGGVGGAGAGLAGVGGPGGEAAAAGGHTGNVSIFGVSTGAVSTGAVTIDLSNTATALAIGGGSYNYSAVPATVAP